MMYHILKKTQTNPFLSTQMSDIYKVSTVCREAAFCWQLQI